jgi:hypothetical protein
MFNEQNTVEGPNPPTPFPAREGGVDAPLFSPLQREKGPGEERGPRACS